MDNLKLQTDPHLKRLACQVYTQMPDDKREALAVLKLVRQLIFCLGEDWETVSGAAPIVPFAQHPKDRGGSLRLVPEAPSDRQDTTNRE